MLRQTVVAALFALAVPALAQQNFPVDRDDCYGDPFVINGKRICWTEFDNSIHPLKPAPPRRTPWVRASFVLPVGAQPAFNGFDAESVRLNQRTDGSRANPVEGAIVTDKHRWNYGNLGTGLDDRTWGARLRVQLPDFRNRWAVRPSPLSLDVSWQKVSPQTLVQVFSNEFITWGRFTEHCPDWTGSCWDYGGRFDSMSQYNEHTVDLQVLRIGVNVDLTHDFWLLSVEPGIGLESSFIKIHTDVEQTHVWDDVANHETIQDREDTSWIGHNDHFRPFISLSVDLYPFGKRSFVAFGVSTRYLLKPDGWAYRNATLIGPYEIPIGNRQWTTTLHGSFVF